MTIKRTLAAVSIAALLPAAAGAVTLGASDVFIDSGFGGIAATDGASAYVPGSNVPEIELTFSAQFGLTPFYAYQEFSTTNLTTVVLENYQPTNSEAARSFFALYNVDTATFVTGGATCNTPDDGGALDILDGSSCQEVAGENGTAGFATPPIEFSGLAGGNYWLAVFESGSPEQVQFDFRISEVPLPAAGWLMLAGIGGLAAMKRRKKS